MNATGRTGANAAEIARIARKLEQLKEQNRRNKPTGLGDIALWVALGLMGYATIRRLFSDGAPTGRPTRREPDEQNAA